MPRCRPSTRRSGVGQADQRARARVRRTEPTYSHATRHSLARGPSWQPMHVCVGSGSCAKPVHVARRMVGQELNGGRVRERACRAATTRIDSVYRLTGGSSMRYGAPHSVRVSCIQNMTLLKLGCQQGPPHLPHSCGVHPFTTQQSHWHNVSIPNFAHSTSEILKHGLLHANQFDFIVAG